MNEDYDRMSLDELRRYVLTHREDDNAFYAYIERSKASGRMISVDLSSDRAEENLDSYIQKMLSHEGEAN